MVRESDISGDHREAAVRETVGGVAVLASIFSHVRAECLYSWSFKPISTAESLNLNIESTRSLLIACSSSPAFVLELSNQEYAQRDKLLQAPIPSPQPISTAPHPCPNQLSSSSIGLSYELSTNDYAGWVRPQGRGSAVPGENNEV